MKNSLKIMRMLTTLSMILLAMLLVSCGGGGGDDGGAPPAPAPTTTDVSGNWKVYHTNAGEPGEEGPDLITITQSGTSFSFTFDFEDGTSVTGMGSINGSEFSASWKEDGSTVTLTGTVTGDTMSGTFAGTDGGSGTWRAERATPAPSPTSPLAGTYTLTGFTVTFPDGTTLAETDVTSYSGSMTVTIQGNQGHMTQTIEVNGIVVNAEGTILSIGTDTIQVSSGGCTYDVGYSLNDNILTTTLPKGTCGMDYSEVDVWEKISSSALSFTDRKPLLQEDRDRGSEQAISGGAVGTIYRFLP